MKTIIITITAAIIAIICQPKKMKQQTRKTTALLKMPTLGLHLLTTFVLDPFRPDDQT
jgi:hypothetical protein